MSKPEERTRNFSNYTITGSLANFLGPVVAGSAIDRLGNRLECATIAAILLSGVVLRIIWGSALPRAEPRTAQTRQ